VTHREGWGYCVLPPNWGNNSFQMSFLFLNWIRLFTSSKISLNWVLLTWAVCHPRATWMTTQKVIKEIC
jgi:hypothetical protein